MDKRLKSSSFSTSSTKYTGHTFYISNALSCLSFGIMLTSMKVVIVGVGIRIVLSRQKQ
uniref:Transmembrane protein n=1 Tax=Anguilla anguilla TaxID=7936 RepID=A0A0E9U7E9_ANGAN